MLSFNCHSTQHLGPACPSAFIQLSFNLTFKASKFPASGILTHVCSKKSESEFWTWLLSGWYLLTLTGKGKRNGHTKWMSQQPQKLSHCLWDLIYSPSFSLVSSVGPHYPPPHDCLGTGRRLIHSTSILGKNSKRRWQPKSDHGWGIHAEINFMPSINF